MATEKTRDLRQRTYATIVYPDSAPNDWQDILARLCIPAFISPLHDKDTNPTGESKKPHYHVLLMFDGKKSAAQVDDIRKDFGGVGVEAVNSIRGYARYLCHLDNPEKAQYNIEEVRQLGGADYTATIGLPTDKYKSIREMKQFIEDNDIYAYCDLFDQACDERPDWFRTLCDNGTVVIKEYLKSKSWKVKQLAEENMLHK